MIKSQFGVFSLIPAVRGFDSDGAIYDQFAFSLNHIKSFESLDDAADYAEFQMKERVKRKIHSSRFVILPIYHSEKDPIFNQ